MKIKKYVIEINADDPFKCATGESLYFTTDALHSFFEEELRNLEEITETPEEAYKRGYTEGIKVGSSIDEDIIEISTHVEEIRKLYDKIRRDKNGR